MKKLFKVFLSIVLSVVAISNADAKTISTDDLAKELELKVSQVNEKSTCYNSKVVKNSNNITIQYEVKDKNNSLCLNPDGWNFKLENNDNVLSMKSSYDSKKQNVTLNYQELIKQDILWFDVILNILDYKETFSSLDQNKSTIDSLLSYSKRSYYMITDSVLKDTKIKEAVETYQEALNMYEKAKGYLDGALKNFKAEDISGKNEYTYTSTSSTQVCTDGLMAGVCSTGFDYVNPTCHENITKCKRECTTDECRNNCNDLYPDKDCVATKNTYELCTIPCSSDNKPVCKDGLMAGVCSSIEFVNPTCHEQITACKRECTTDECRNGCNDKYPDKDCVKTETVYKPCIKSCSTDNVQVCTDGLMVGVCSSIEFVNPTCHEQITACKRECTTDECRNSCNDKYPDKDCVKTETVYKPCIKSCTSSSSNTGKCTNTVLTGKKYSFQPTDYKRYDLIKGTVSVQKDDRSFYGISSITGPLNYGNSGTSNACTWTANYTFDFKLSYTKSFNQTSFGNESKIYKLKSSDDFKTIVNDALVVYQKAEDNLNKSLNQNPFYYLEEFSYKLSNNSSNGSTDNGNNSANNEDKKDPNNKDDIDNPQTGIIIPIGIIIIGLGTLFVIRYKKNKIHKI